MTQAIFLDAHDTTHRIRAMIAGASEASLAVAYWGKGACKELGLDGRKIAVRVVCDLFSGGCNPKEIKRLLSAGVKVRTKSSLHSKVYCMPSSVLVGSSNASTNGLGFEGAETKANIEANLFSDDPKVIADTLSWFEANWNSALDVDAALADEAMPFWKQAQEHRIPRIKGTLLSEIESHPQKYKDAELWIALYKLGMPSAAARKSYKNAAPQIYSGQQSRELAEYYPFYEDDNGKFPVKPGVTTVLDFCYESEAKVPEFYGLWRVRDGNYSVPMEVKGHPKARIVMCDLLHEYRGLRLPKQEVREIAKRLYAYSNKNQVWNDTSKKKNHGFAVWLKLIDFLEVR